MTRLAVLLALLLTGCGERDSYEAFFERPTLCGTTPQHELCKGRR